MFAKLDYLISVDYERMFQKNKEFEKAFKLETYDRLITNPFVDQEKVTRDFLLEPLVQSEASTYIKKQPQELGLGQGLGLGRGTFPPPTGSRPKNPILQSVGV